MIIAVVYPLIKCASESKGLAVYFCYIVKNTEKIVDLTEACSPDQCREEEQDEITD